MLLHVFSMSPNSQLISQSATLLLTHNISPALQRICGTTMSSECSQALSSSHSSYPAEFGGASDYDQNPSDLYILFHWNQTRRHYHCDQCGSLVSTTGEITYHGTTTTFLLMSDNQNIDGALEDEGLNDITTRRLYHLRIAQEVVVVDPLITRSPWSAASGLHWCGWAHFTMSKLSRVLGSYRDYILHPLPGCIEWHMSWPSFLFLIYCVTSYIIFLQRTDERLAFQTLYLEHLDLYLLCMDCNFQWFPMTQDWRLMYGRPSW